MPSEPVWFDGKLWSAGEGVCVCVWRGGGLEK